MFIPVAPCAVWRIWNGKQLKDALSSIDLFSDQRLTNQLYKCNVAYHSDDCTLTSGISMAFAMSPQLLYLPVPHCAQSTNTPNTTQPTSSGKERFIGLRYLIQCRPAGKSSRWHCSKVVRFSLRPPHQPWIPELVWSAARQVPAGSANREMSTVQLNWGGNLSWWNPASHSDHYQALSFHFFFTHGRQISIGGRSNSMGQAILSYKGGSNWQVYIRRLNLLHPFKAPQRQKKQHPTFCSPVFCRPHG